MKKIIYRKLLLDCMVFFFITLISLSVIIWVFQAVNFLDIIIEDGRDLSIYLKYSILNFPKIFSKILPFALFFSFTFVLGKYEINNELIIFWNFGVHKLTIINFFLKFSILILLVQLLLTVFLVPISQENARTYLRDSKINFLESLFKPKKFNDSIKGLTIYSEDKGIGGDMINLYLKKETNENNYQITYAKKGKIQDVNGNKILVLQEGETINFLNGKITNFSFLQSSTNISNLESNTTTYSKTQESSTTDLIKCFLGLTEKFNNYKKINIKNIKNCSKKNYENIIQELYKRFFIPLYIPVLVVISLLIIIYSKEEINFLKFRIIIFLIGFFTIIISETSMRFLNVSFYSNLKIFLIPFIIFFIFYTYFKIKLIKKLNYR